MKRLLFLLLFVSAFSQIANGQSQPAPKLLVVIAGTASHKAGEHEYNAGALLIKKWLDSSPDMTVTTCLNGWPADTTLLDRADGIVLFMDGKQGHLVLNPAQQKSATPGGKSRSGRSGPALCRHAARWQR